MIEPKKLAIKVNPAKLAIEYFSTALNQNLLLEIDLENYIKIYSDIKKITEILFKTYPDVLIRDLIDESQIENLINAIIFKKQYSTKTNPYLINESFPKEKEKFYSKSNQNFFSNSKVNEINFVDQDERVKLTHIDSNAIKNELKHINKNNRYDDKYSKSSGFKEFNDLNNSTGSIKSGDYNSNKSNPINIEYPTQEAINQHQKHLHHDMMEKIDYSEI